MILINLLPHREIARKKARQAFNMALLVSAAVGAAIGGVIYMWYQGQIEMQEGRNQFLISENQKLDAEIKEIANLQNEIDALKARQRAVETLQADRNLPVHLFNELVQQLPEGMYLKSIKQEGRSVLIGGAAQSSERVSELLRNLTRNTEWVRQPELIEVVAGDLSLSKTDKRRVYNFTVRAQLGSAESKAETDGK